MHRKILIIALLWWLMVCYESCCEYLPYFLYESVVVDALDTTEIPAGDSLKIFIRPLVTQYVSQRAGVMQQAMAWQCVQGESGPKYPIESIRIITINNFDTNHPAGSVVTDLFLIRYYSQKDVMYKDAPLTNLEDLNEVLLNVLWLKARPENTAAAEFRVELVNSKGQRITGTSPIITWL
jgi:hypothetical protein